MEFSNIFFNNFLLFLRQFKASAKYSAASLVDGLMKFFHGSFPMTVSYLPGKISLNLCHFTSLICGSLLVFLEEESREEELGGKRLSVKEYFL